MAESGTKQGSIGVFGDSFELATVFSPPASLSDVMKVTVEGWNINCIDSDLDGMIKAVRYARNGKRHTEGAFMVRHAQMADEMDRNLVKDEVIECSILEIDDLISNM